MVQDAVKEVFLQLVRLGVGASEDGSGLHCVFWDAMENLSAEQGLMGVVLDGMERLDRDVWPPKKEIIRSIGQVVQQETQYAVRQNAAAEMAALFAAQGIRTYVLKGDVVAECYPRPIHRVSVDMDCYLAVEDGASDVWERGNRLMEEKGFKVRRDYYKNSTFILPGLTVENHRYLTPFRGNKKLMRLERWLQSRLKASAALTGPAEVSRFEGTQLYRPPVMVSALFLVEHAYSHFLHEGLTWRHVLDWQMFSRRHREEIDWKELDARMDEFGLKRFYESFERLGKYLIGELGAERLEGRDRLMREDIWAPLDLHETVSGWRGKLALAGNTWRARWKYREFTDISWLAALWIQAKGFLFEKEPSLE